MKHERLTASFVPSEGEDHDMPYVNLMSVSRRELSTLRCGIRALLREHRADPFHDTADEMDRMEKHLDAVLTDLSKYV